MSPQVSPERSGWRDLELSLRHRTYGFDAPMIDLDFMVVEYDLAEPVALVSYKLDGAPPESRANLKAFTRLAVRAGLPAFEVRYAANMSWFAPVPLEDAAKRLMGNFAGVPMAEREYVQWLYWLRGRKVPHDILQSLSA